MYVFTVKMYIFSVEIYVFRLKIKIASYACPLLVAVRTTLQRDSNSLVPGTCHTIYKIQIPATRYHIGKRGSFYLHKSGYVIMTN